MEPVNLLWDPLSSVAQQGRCSVSEPPGHTEFRHVQEKITQEPEGQQELPGDSLMWSHLVFTVTLPGG